MYRVLDDAGLSASSLDRSALVALYTDMVRARRFDERALALQRRGWMSGYPPFRGQEASQIGAAHAMEDDDWLFPTYRSNAMLLALGRSMADILLFRRGHGEWAHDTEESGIFPQSIPIATQIPHATGAAMATQYCENDHAVVCYFGDGATSEGDFHEGLNFAGVFETPTVFFCENNHWAISVPTSRQTASETIAQKAEAYGFEGIQVDGTDPIAVYNAVEAGLEEARNGSPVLIESLTYRHGPHTTSDDPSRYADAYDDVPDWRKRDPLERFETALLEAGHLEESTIEAIEGEADEEIDQAIEAAEATEPPAPEAIFEHVYAGGLEVEKPLTYEK